MDVTPPTLLRRLGIALAGLAVAALTGVACVLSFDDLRALAVTGGARPDLAYLYPAGFDALLVVTLICVLLLRSARALVRAQAAIVLALLIAAAAAIDVGVALGRVFPREQTTVGVALAPWVMLALGLWLWLLLIKHVQAARSSVRDADSTDESDIVPFHPGAETAPTVEAPRPVTVPQPREESSLPAPPSPEDAPPAAPEAKPVADPAPEAPPVEAASRVDGPVTWPAEEAAAVPRPREEPEQPERPEPAEEQGPTRPVRWGDRVQPTDVLVHPRVSPEERRSADTQPVPVVRAEDPDPGHGAEAAEESETAQSQEADFREATGAGAEPDARDDEYDRLEDTAPHPIVEENEVPPTEAPSSRLRSTPRPPED